MQLVSIKAISAMLWVATVTFAGITPNGWPWNDPRQTMSESIQEALR